MFLHELRGSVLLFAERECLFVSRSLRTLRGGACISLCMHKYIHTSISLHTRMHTHCRGRNTEEIGAACQERSSGMDVSRVSVRVCERVYICVCMQTAFGGRCLLLATCLSTVFSLRIRISCGVLSCMRDPARPCLFFYRTT